MTEKDKKDTMAEDNGSRTDLGDVMLVPVEDDEEGQGAVLTEAEARAFMERPIAPQKGAGNA